MRQRFRQIRRFAQVTIYGSGIFTHLESSFDFWSCLFLFFVHPSHVSSPDGSQLASMTWKDGESQARLWEVATGDCLAVMHGSRFLGGKHLN
jgi:WD40 repeat protein